MKYPKNIYDFFSDGRDEDFSMWAFGCKQPGSNNALMDCWDKLHPEYPMITGETLCLCICKMNYLYQKERKCQEKE